MSGVRNRWAACKLAGALACLLVAALAQPAAAFERVSDGGFDSASCTTTDCVSPFWTESRAGMSPIGPICEDKTDDCTDSSGSGFDTGPNWARLGAGVTATTAVAQTIQIPAAPAKLIFLLHIAVQPNGSDALSVTVDGNQVFSATDATPGFATYQRVEIDVSRFARGGTHVLRFQGKNTATTTPSDSFDVDEVSLDAADGPPPPNHDRDGDKYLDRASGGPDCDDTNPGINPGATDVPHDGIDQDCKGGDAPYPKLRGRVGIEVAYSVPPARKYTLVTSLKLRRAPVGATVSLVCSSRRKGCRIRRKTLTVKSTKTIQLARYLKKSRLRRRAAITVRVTKPGYIGRFFRYRIVRYNHLPPKATHCLEPGSTAPQKTCS